MKREDEIIALEKRFWQTMIDRDVDTAAGLMADRSIVTGAQGASTIDRKAFAKMMSGGQWTLKAFAFDKTQVLFAGDDVAVIAYEVTEELEVDGKPLTLVAYDASTWSRADGGQWKCVLHTESVKGDPFGRRA
jgi:ketosteroid isomerase-like protein